MSLKSFHILFITLSSLLAFTFGAWTLAQDAGAGFRGLGVLAFVAGAALVAYGIWFLKKIRTPDKNHKRRRARLRPLVVLVPLWLSGARDALACSVCYGEAEGPLIDAARMGAWLLFGLVVCLQIVFALFFLVLWRRARKYRQGETALP